MEKTEEQQQEVQRLEGQCLSHGTKLPTSELGTGLGHGVLWLRPSRRLVINLSVQQQELKLPVPRWGCLETCGRLASGGSRYVQVVAGTASAKECTVYLMQGHNQSQGKGQKKKNGCENRWMKKLCLFYCS